MSENTRVAISRENAVLLLAAAEELGLEPGVVATYEGGFGAPDEVLKKAGFDPDSGLPTKKAAKEAQDEEKADPNTIGSGDPDPHDFDPTLSDAEVQARQDAAEQTSGEGAVEPDKADRKVATTDASDQGEPPTTRPTSTRQAAKKATAKSTRKG